MLYPHEVIEYMIGIIIVFVCLIFAIFMYRKNRQTFGFYITTIVLISTISFFIFHPIWIDKQINKKSLIVENHLQATYPDVDWTITAQNYREDKTVNPYYLLVNFADDPDHTYFYYVYKGGKVKQMGSQKKHGSLSTEKYDEID